MSSALKRFQKLLQAPQEWLLIEEAKRGDKEAFGRLYEHYVDQIYRYIFFQVYRKREVAEDLTAEVFMKGWIHIKTFSGGSIKAWLYQIARNSVIDFFRGHKEHGNLEETMPHEGESLEETVEGILAIDKVRLAMKQLTEEQQEVITLKFVEDFSNKEIAKLLGKREDAIRAMQYRAIKQLRQELGEAYE